MVVYFILPIHVQIPQIPIYSFYFTVTPREDTRREVK